MEPNHSALFYLKRITGLILLTSLSAVFLFSAWSKLQTIDPFAWTFIDLAPVNMTTAAILARLFIGFEATIGIFLLAHIFLRSFTYKATLILLALLTGYLALLLYKQGNTGNCACFGEWIYMKPARAAWKNIALMGITGLLFYLYPVKPYQQQYLAAVILAMAALTLPFIMRPVYLSEGREKAHDPIDLSAIYIKSTPVPATDLRGGKHIIAYLSATCPHCKKGAYLIQILHRQYPSFPLFMLINGTPDLERSFLEETKSAAVPHALMGDTPAFTKMSGPAVPTILWINNSVVEFRSYYTDLEPGTIREWLKQDGALK